MKKVILIGCGIFILLLICIGSCAVIGGFAFNKIIETGIDAKNGFLVDVCEESKSLTATDYEDIFSSGFKNSNNFFETQLLLKEAFPSNYKCSDLKTNNLFVWL